MDELKKYVQECKQWSELMQDCEKIIRKMTDKAPEINLAVVYDYLYETADHIIMNCNKIMETVEKLKLK